MGSAQAQYLFRTVPLMRVSRRRCSESFFTRGAESPHKATRAIGVDTTSMEFRTVPDQEAALAYDVRRIRSWPFLPRDMVIAGAMYDVHTGRIMPRDV